MKKRKLKLTKTKDAEKKQRRTPPSPGYILNKGVPVASSVDQLVV